MHITRYTDYSLRVLMYLGLKGDEVTTIGEIANHYDISKNHLMKVAQQLNNHGFLVAIRGKNGGLRLSQPPESLNIGELVRFTEQEFALVECNGHNNHCVLTPACQLKNIFDEALESFFATMDHYTLADLLPPERKPQLTMLLQLSAAAK